MPKKCFVVMGFGEKTDLATGRTLDLDKTYRIIIKKAVEEAGLECIRADDMIHRAPSTSRCTSICSTPTSSSRICRHRT